MPEQVPDGSIVITPKEFYDGVRSDIGEIKNDVSGLRSELSSLPTRVDRLEAKVEALDTRLDVTDKKIVWLAGFAAGAGGTLGTILTKFLA